MDRIEFVRICDSRLRILRAELSLSQERMAYALGISKKTLVEIEKERSSLGWTGAVALCALFGQSETIMTTFGGQSERVISSLVFDGVALSVASNNPLGKIWWETVRREDGYIVEQNVISLHYRLLDTNGEKITSSFDIEDIDEYIEAHKKDGV